MLLFIMNNFQENFDNEFTIFLNNLNKLYPNDEVLLYINNESIEQKIQRIQKMLNLLNNKNNFNNLCKSKIKLFSHKEKDTLAISESVFGKTLSLKKIFNNQSDEVKQMLWKNLQKLIFILLEEQNKITPSKDLEEKISKLEIKFLKIDETKKSIQKLFQTDKLNNTTNDMINDIFNSFENAMNEKDTINNILNISSQLTKKYEDQISNGEIDLNSLVNNLKNNIPGMENIKNIIDPLLNMNGLTDLTGLINSNEPKEKIIMDENFSTANIETGTEETAISKPVIGNMLKVADNTGMLNMISNTSDNKSNDTNNLNNLFNNLNLSDDKNNLSNLFNNLNLNLSDDKGNGLNKLFNIIDKLKENGLDNKDGLNDIFKNDLGIDIEKIEEMKKNN